MADAAAAAAAGTTGAAGARPSYDIRPNAQTGFTAAAAYDAHRPSYPDESVQALLSAVGVAGQAGARLLEIGAGTGKFTALLAARPEAFDLVSVEPHEQMRSVLEQKRLKGVRVVPGNAESLAAVEDDWADAVIIAQCGEWWESVLIKAYRFANLDALREMHKKVVPGGVLGLIWNIEDYNSPLDWEPATKWEAKMKDVIWSFDDDDPRFRHQKWQAVFDEQLKGTPATIQLADPLFSLPLGENIVRWTVWLPNKQAVWDRFYTISHIAVLEGAELEATKKKVFDALEGPDVETNHKGEIALHGRTCVYWTTAIPSTS